MTFTLREDDRLRFPGCPQKESEKVVAEIAALTDTVLLSFSGGKDAIAAWLAIRPHFKRVIPYYYYLVPDLEFVEESLRYYEDFFQTPILRYPNPNLYRMLNNEVFQPPCNLATIRAWSLPSFDYDDLRDVICQDESIPLDTFTATGVRAADSLNRRSSFKRHGGINYNRRVFYPIWDWKKAALIESFVQAKVKMPVDYQIFGRSFDGLDFRFIYPMRKYFPADYEKVRAYFPMIEVEFKRYEYAQAHKNARS